MADSARGIKRTREETDEAGDEFAHLFGGSAPASAAGNGDESNAADIQAIVDSAEHADVCSKARSVMQ